MKKLSTKGQKVLKIIHLLTVIMWIGGVIALVTLQFGVTPYSKDTMYIGALSHYMVDKVFLIPGGVGVVLTGLIYGFFTGWGFIKQNWLIVKWIGTIVLVIIGVPYMGTRLDHNMIYAERLLTESLDQQLYWNNVYEVAIAGVVQLIIFFILVVVSVIKPWKKQNSLK